MAIRFKLKEDGETYSITSFIAKYGHLGDDVSDNKIRARWYSMGKPAEVTLEILEYRLRGNFKGEVLRVVLLDGSVEETTMNKVKAMMNSLTNMNRPLTTYQAWWKSMGKPMPLRLEDFLKKAKSGSSSRVDLSHIPEGDLAKLSDSKNTGAARVEAEHWESVGIKKYRGGESFCGYTSRGNAVYNSRF